MKHRPGFDLRKTPREEVLLDTGEKPEEPKGSPIALRHWFAMTPQELLFDGNISMGAKALYGVYHCYATNKYHPRITITREMAAKHLGASIRRVSTLKNELDGKGWIEVKHRGQGKSDAITLNEYPFQTDDRPRKDISDRALTARLDRALTARSYRQREKTGKKK